jgi:hypothetical protein
MPLGTTRASYAASGGACEDNTSLQMKSSRWVSPVAAYRCNMSDIAVVTKQGM